VKQDCKIIVFAKAPVAGFAKTRLASVIGNEAAANLAARMLSETVAQAAASNLGAVELCCAPDTSHAQFLFEKKMHKLELSEQGEGDLGQRMCRAFERALTDYQRVILIGTDAPDLQSVHLISAANTLREHAVVFAPAHDGGYVLVGLSRSMPSLFEEISWSTSQVMAQTRSKLATLGECYFEFPSMHDVDEAQDLDHVPASWMLT
jgi:rSAM/selenodomain-associated transferase 1